MGCVAQIQGSTYLVRV